MAESKPQYYKLASIVDNFMIENDLPDGWFAKSLVFAIRGLRELSLDTWNDVKTVLLDVSDQKTVLLPDDFVDWSYVGIQIGQYRVAIGVNDELNTLNRRPDSPSVAGLPTQHMPNGIDFDAYNYNFNNYAGGGFWCRGLVTKGFFKVFDNGQCKQLLIDYDYPIKKVYVNYITDGFNPCEETIIHPYLYDYLVKYMEHKYEEKNNPKATESSIDRKARDVFWAEKRIRARKNNLDPQTLLNITRQYTTLAIKM